jgi:dTDP-3-amino-2,3,6-trideoxy-4-keto-D-glucose/dTDP-3-amino-3,4,6-trideoxy-alpha-D-glucose/dTDP-2,6-dideoxy-D-kanosamine transaminase
MSTLPINDLSRHTMVVGADIRRAIERVVGSHWHILGPEVSAFEREFAEYCGATHCVGVASGTDALELAFRALAIGTGKRVATVANAGCYTTVALNIVGATPVFVDVEEDSRLMSLECLERLAAAGDVDAVVVTHLFGLMHDMQPIRTLADRANIPVIEDCAQAHGARRDGRMAGSIGDVACFSFYPTKNLGAIGDGGALVTNDPDVASRLRCLRQYGWETKYRIVSPGGRNSRLDELQAAVLRAKLPHLDRWNARRREIAARYSASIKSLRIGCPPVRGEEYVAHLYVVTCEDPSGLQRHLAAVGIASEIHYPIPDHLQPFMRENGPRHSLPVTERLAQRILTLPCFPELRDQEVDYIIHRVNIW